jgi:hypothetical protein
MEIRKPSVTFKNDEYEQQPSNIQPMAEQRGSIYANEYQQQQQQQPYTDQGYVDQSYYQPQTTYQQQPEYDYSNTTTYSQPQSNVGYVSSGYESEQYSIQQQPNYQQESGQGYYQSESRRQSPEKEIYQQQQQQQQQHQQQQQQQQQYSNQPRNSDSRRQSPENDYQRFAQPETPKRASPPREQAVANEVVQQRQQSRDQLYGREEEPVPPKATTQRQQSRDNLSEEKVAPAKSNINPSGKQMAPASPKRSIAARKGGNEQKTGRNTLGEATGTGRKSDSVQKQPAKTVTSVRGKK